MLTALLLAELMPQQLSVQGYSWPIVTFVSVGIYLARLFIEAVLIRLGIDVGEFIVIETKQFLVRIGWIKIKTKIKQAELTKQSKLIKYFFALDHWGIFLTAAAPFAPPSIGVTLYNLRQKRRGKLSIENLFFNLNFLMLMSGGCARMLLVVAIYYSVF